MQHPDEGTIHSWLDGALSADEAARVEAHVKECPQCEAAMAEARGFIAGASRILMALDNAPRGVIPAAAPKKRMDPLVWRVAATVLFVAAGTLVVVRNRGGSQQLMRASLDTAMISQQRASAPERVSAAAESPSIAGDTRIGGNTPTAAYSTKPKAVAGSPSRIALGGQSGARDSDPAASTREDRESDKVAQSSQGTITRGLAQAAPPAAAAAAPIRDAGGVAALDAAMNRSEPLNVVGTPRRIGVKVTLYEVAPGDTVTLTEPLAMALNSMVVTGTATATMRQQATAKSAAPQSKARPDDASVTTMSDSSRVAEARPSAPARAPAMAAAGVTPQAATGNALHTITWIDSGTGNTLTLTGRMSEARLQEIKIRIERERAAAATKKTPD